MLRPAYRYENLYVAQVEKKKKRMAGWSNRFSFSRRRNIIVLTISIIIISPSLIIKRLYTNGTNRMNLTARTVPTAILIDELSFSAIRRHSGCQTRVLSYKYLYFFWSGLNLFTMKRSHDVHYTIVTNA